MNSDIRCQTTPCTPTAWQVIAVTCLQGGNFAFGKTISNENCPFWHGAVTKAYFKEDTLFYWPVIDWQLPPLLILNFFRCKLKPLANYSEYTDPNMLNKLPATSTGKSRRAKKAIHVFNFEVPAKVQVWFFAHHFWWAQWWTRPLGIIHYNVLL
jgi:hypothetical protein